jgi:hypothetical protein
MDFITTLIATFAVATAIAYNADSAEGTAYDEPQATPVVSKSEVPPPAPPDSGVVIVSE